MNENRLPLDANEFPFENYGFNNYNIYSRVVANH